MAIKLICLNKLTLKKYTIIVFCLYLFMILLFNSIINEVEINRHIHQRKDFQFLNKTWFNHEHKPWIKNKVYNTKCSGEKEGAKHEFVDIVSGLLYVFSAYYDDRPNDFDNKDNGSYVRIMAVSKQEFKVFLECVFMTSDGVKIYANVSWYEMCENHGAPYGGYILSCQVPSKFLSAAPCSVQVSFSQQESRPISVIPVRPQKNQTQFGICVPPLFGNIDKKKLIEFIELSKILGAEKITFYNYNMPKDIIEVLDYYWYKGLVSVVSWDYPSQLKGKISWYHGQLISIQDCLYRNMPTTKYLAFNDIDEFIVPRQYNNWHELTDNTFNPYQCAFCFASAYFTESYNLFWHNSDLFSMVTKRTATFDEKRTKCMVKPYMIFEKGIHHISKPIMADMKVSRMLTDLAFLHHYRTPHRRNRNFQTDTHLLKYQSELTRQVDSVMEIL